MKDAAKIVDMSYSTAKKIYGKFRKNNMQKKTIGIEESVSVSDYRVISNGEQKPIQIICLLAGHLQ